MGAGGHGRVVLDAILCSDVASPIGVLDPNPELQGTLVLGVPVLGDDDALHIAVSHGATHFVVGIGSIGDASARTRAEEACRMAGLVPITVVHPKAVVSDWAELAPGCQVMAGAIVQAGAKVGAFAIVNTAAVVEHDCSVGAYSHVATGARLCGNVQVSDLAHIGAGSTIRQGILVGSGAIVGAGAVVVSDVPPNRTVVGVPARCLQDR